MSRDAIAELVQSFVQKKFPAAKKRTFGLDVPLLESGIIDSLGVLDLVGFLEQSFAIKIEDDDLTPDNFGSINSICSFVEKKKAQLEVSTG